MTLYIFRCTSVNTQGIEQSAKELVSKTTFQKASALEQAPALTDCLTSIHFIFMQAMGINIPLTFIGDMPRQLCALGQWKFLCIKPAEARCGDVIFVKFRKMKKLISHAALFLGPSTLFHCTRTFGTASIHSTDTFFSLYEQKLPGRQALRYIDARNRELREKHSSIFL